MDLGGQNEDDVDAIPGWRSKMIYSELCTTFEGHNFFSIITTTKYYDF